MKEKKLQVFVSSTYNDLKEERQAAVEAILSSGHIPAGMELFSAGDESQMTVIERWIDQSDVFLLILGGRYGSIDKKTGKSYIHLEYEYAIKTSKPLFAVVINQDALETKIKSFGSLVIEQDNTKELRMFREEVLTNLVRFWDDKKDIKLAIHETLSDFGYRKDLIGWIKGSNSVNTGLLAEEIARLTNENFELRKLMAIQNSDSNALYSNLTYEQLASLLKNESIEFDNKATNLLEFVVSQGAFLTTGMLEDFFPKGAIHKLKLFKLIAVARTDKGFRGLRFTQDGHNFYLKALYVAASEK